MKKRPSAAAYIGPAEPAQTAAATPNGPTADLHPLVPGSVTARALYEAWSGTSRAVVIDSPPGAGKSTTAATIAAHLAAAGGLSVGVATPTRRQAVDIATRIAHQAPPGRVLLGLSGITVAEATVDFGFRGTLVPHNGMTVPRAGHIAVGTVASFKASPRTCDVLIVDEGYQITWADLAAAADAAQQAVVVGDPGQIGPVVTIDTTEWRRMARGPQHPAPQVLRQLDDVTTMHMNLTHRFGADTVRVVAPLYAFPFTTARPATAVHDTPEVRAVQAAGLGPAGHHETLRQVAALAAGLNGRVLTAAGHTPRPLTPADIAVVVSRNIEQTAIRAALNSAGMNDTAVGTADKMQGGQWAAVVALDPLVGSAAHGASPHSLSLGRLCVMLTRHRAHVTFVTDRRYPATFDAAQVSDRDATIHAEVRRRLHQTGG